MTNTGHTIVKSVLAQDTKCWGEITTLIFLSSLQEWYFPHFTLHCSSHTFTTSPSTYLPPTKLLKLVNFFSNIIWIEKTTVTFIFPSSYKRFWPMSVMIGSTNIYNLV